jgi:pantetheine-phosphate adenylyltransferase
MSLIKEKLGIYPGSFDPITNGHIDIINRALVVFDKIYIAVFNNLQKQYLFTPSERVHLIEQSFEGNDRIIVEEFGGLAVNYAQQKNTFTMIRGLRAISDFDYEIQLAHTNRQLNDKMDTVFFMTDSKYSYISSSLVKQIAEFEGDTEAFVPAHVLNALKEKHNHG